MKMNVDQLLDTASELNLVLGQCTMRTLLSRIARYVKMTSIVYRGIEAFEASSNKIARYHIQICVYDTEAYLAKIENLEFETHGNWIFSIFLRVVSLRKKCLSIIFGWFLKISPGANNPEEFLLSLVRIVQWENAMQIKMHWSKWVMRWCNAYVHCREEGCIGL